MRVGKLGRIACAAALGLGAALVGCSLDGADTAPPSSTESRAAMGHERFLAYCAACHGAGALGDGPVAASLVQRPADLTRISERAGGVFDAPAVAGFIDGRSRIAAHGPSDMPVWGRRFDDRTSTAVSDETRLDPGTIYLIVEYLRTIQAAD
jgi:mono/diheme cytochrome c family protein